MSSGRFVIWGYGILQRFVSLIASAVLLLCIIAATAIAAHYATPTRGQVSPHTISATTSVTSTTNTNSTLMVVMFFPNGTGFTSGNLSADGHPGILQSDQQYFFSGLKPGTYQLNLTTSESVFLPPTSAQLSPGTNSLNLTVHQLNIFRLVNTPNLAFNNTQPGPNINVKNGTAVRLMISNNTTQVFNVAVVQDLYNISSSNVLFDSLSNTISAGGSVNDTFIASSAGTFYYQSMTANQAKQGEYGNFTVAP